MSRVRRQLRQALTIARRDFVATVFTPIFLLFLFAPLIMGSFGAIGGLGAASAADSAAQTLRIVAIAPPADSRDLAAADRRLRRLFRTEEAPPELRIVAPAGDPEAQVRALMTDRQEDIIAVLRGPLARPVIAFDAQGRRSAAYLAEVAEQTLRSRTAGNADLSQPTLARTAHAVPRQGGRNQSAFLAVFGVFFLTLFLAGQVVGSMAEERTNKVIEVLAAAVPLESVFLGKLLGMFGVAVLFVGFWTLVLANVAALLPPGAAGEIAALRPAVGFGPFALLFAAYFTMAYLLLGSVFLGVGAQASTAREIQMLSLPITILQVAMFALSSAAASKPGSTVATFAELFPLSSPFAMAGHAASTPDLWPHFAALAWQALWVAIFISVGARLFRRGVLQSGGATGLWTRLFARTGRTSIDTNVN
jgi:ABC-2 type transport system permease protein